MNWTKSALGIGLLLGVMSFGHAQDNPFDLPGQAKAKQAGIEERVKEVSIAVEPAKARRGETVVLNVTFQLQPGFHTYPTKQPDPKAEAFVTDLSFKLPPALVFSGPVADQPARTKIEEVAGLDANDPKRKVKVTEYEEGVVYRQKVLIGADAKPGEAKIEVKLATQVCDDKGCVPYSKTLEAVLSISDAPPIASTATAPVTPAAASSADFDPAQRAAREGLGPFLLYAVIFGVVALLTPCVFPMIPITVSYFLKQSEKEHHSPLNMALVYSGTIVVVLTAGTVLMLGTFQSLSQHWAANLALGALFLVFALSLFGMYEIRLPSSLATFTSSREGQGGVVGTVFMALTFTIISFTCVAPFMGGFAGLTAAASSGFDWVKIVLGGLVFSVTFAAPFFLLALFPSLLKSLPKSGAWMNTVKVVMGFIEVAAAIKFFRSSELFLLEGTATFLTYELSLGMYVALCFACGLYLLNVFRMDHDSPAEGVGTIRLLFSLTFLSLAFYLLPGLFADATGNKQRPRGAVFNWLDAFLLRDAAEEAVALPAGGKGSELAGKLAWDPDLKKSLEVAKQQDRRVFIDFTGVT